MFTIENTCNKIFQGNEKGVQRMAPFSQVNMSELHTYFAGQYYVGSRM